MANFKNLAAMRRRSFVRSSRGDLAAAAARKKPSKEIKRLSTVEAL